MLLGWREYLMSCLLLLVVKMCSPLARLDPATTAPTLSSIPHPLLSADQTLARLVPALSPPEPRSLEEEQDFS
jgi:hypothetical protein